MTWDIEWRELNDTGNETLVTGLTTAEYTLTGGGIDYSTTQYELRARQVDGAETSDWTAWVESGVFIPVPTGLNFSSVQQTSMRMGWSGVAATYNVELERWETTPTYATWDPAKKHADITLSGGNLVATKEGNSAYRSVGSTTGVSSGKHYWEIVIDVGTLAFVGVGSASADLGQYAGSNAHSWSYFALTGLIYHNGAGTDYGDPYAIGDIVGIALDMDAGKIWFSKNGVWQNSGNPATGIGEAFSGLSGTIYAYISPYAVGDKITANFGASSLTYTPLSGFNEGLYTTSVAWVAEDSDTGVTDLYHDWTGLTASTLYRGRVQAVDGAETSARTDWVEETTAAASGGATASGGFAAASLTPPTGGATATQSVTASGDLAPVSLAAPTGAATVTQSVSASGALAAASLIAPTGSASTGVNVVASGALAPISLTAPTGAATTSQSALASGDLAPIDLIAPTGAATAQQSVTASGDLAAVSLAAPTGSVSTGVNAAASGDIAPTSLMPPTGAATTSQSAVASGALAPLSLVALTGAATTSQSVVASGDVAPISLAPPTGAATAGTDVVASGDLASASLTAPTGAATTSQSVVASGSLAPVSLTPPTVTVTVTVSVVASGDIPPVWLTPPFAPPLVYFPFAPYPGVLDATAIPGAQDATSVAGYTDDTVVPNAMRH